MGDRIDLSEVLAAILVCVEDRLREPVLLATVMPGTSAVWDECCEGELWVHLRGIDGVATAAMQPCLPWYTATVGIGVLRCAHVIDDAGRPPTAEQMTGDAVATIRDMEDVVAGLVCCFIPLEVVDKPRIGGWVPLGPEGGCVGGEVTFTFNYSLCLPCG